MHKSKKIAILRVSVLKELLLQNNMSQNALAGKLGISSGYCSNVMVGSRRLSPQLRTRLLKLFKADFYTLFEIEEVQKGQLKTP